MIRFLPDSWLEAVVRPIAMALPTGSVYIETIAPDFRFVFALALALAWLAWRVRARAAAARTLALLAFCAAAFVPWLVTSGNGRYFIPVLLVVGPLCIALLHHLPLERSKRLGLGVAMLVAQLALLHEVEPWNSWGMAHWGDGPAFAIDVPQDLRAQPATYVTLSGNSYSLIAPNFHPQSRWINIASQQGRWVNDRDVQRLQQLLDASPVIYLLFPSLPQQSVTPQPDPAALDAVELATNEQRLGIDRAQPCRWLASEGLTALGSRRDGAADPDPPRGFWACPARRTSPASGPAQPLRDPEIEAVFNRVERLCPRMFPPRSAPTGQLLMGARRFYTESDMRLYVLEDGRVMYKYMRALNPVFIGTSKEVLAEGFRMDCNIRGRAGLPWEREI
jgi:hypothetical protein